MTKYKKFSWIASCLLTMVTCSFYSVYMYYYMAKAGNEEAERFGVKTIMGYIPALLLGCVTCGIYPVVWLYQFFKQQSEIAKKKGVKMAPTDSPIVLLLLTVVPFYSWYVICDNYNRVIAE